MKLVLYVLFAIANISGEAMSSEAPVIWQDEFDKPESLTDGRFYYEERGSGKKGNDVVVSKFDDGIFYYGLKFDPDRNQDRLNLMFGDCVWGAPKSGWGPFDTKRFPFVEIKWRGNDFTFYYGIETADGRRLGAYTFPPVVRKEIDDRGREWNISLFRVAPDSSVPGIATAVKLLGFNLALFSPREKEAPLTEIDYIRVRGFTDNEKIRENKIIANLKNFPEGRWKGYDTFFPFGIFESYLRNDFESWAGDYEGAYGNYVRHYFNFVPSNDEVELGRYGQRGTGVDTYIKEMKKLIEYARATGMKLGADVRRIMDGWDHGEGYEQILPIAKKLTEAFGDDEIIVSWKIADEPGLSRLLPLTCSMRALREADPLNRPQVIEFNAPSKMASYAPYLNLNCWDNYPILEGSRNPWGIRELAQQYRKILPGQPMWVVLQSFETRPPAPKGSYIRPSEAEIRMMAYQALAEGAKGLIWFCGWVGYGRDEGLVDRTGRPRGKMMETLKDLGKRLIPIGRLLLETDYAEGTVIKTQQDELSDGKGIVVSVLKHRNLPLHYLIAVNEDLTTSRSATVTIPAGMLLKGQGVYDLYSLDGNNLARSGKFQIQSLAGGDGRIYLVATIKEFQRQKTAILCSQAEEQLRVLTPDLTIARRWKLDLGEMDAAVKACRASIKTKKAPEALKQAARAQELLFNLIENNSELHATRVALSGISEELAEVSRITEHFSKTPRWWTGRDHPMLIPNPGFLELSELYWKVGRSYRDLHTLYLNGQKDGLWQKLNTTRMECLQMRENVLAMLRGKLMPKEE